MFCMAEVENQIKMCLWGRGLRSGGWRESVGSGVDVVLGRLTEITGGDVTVTSVNWPVDLQLPSLSWTASVKADGVGSWFTFLSWFCFSGNVRNWLLFYSEPQLFYFLFCFLSVHIRSTGFDVESIRKRS